MVYFPEYSSMEYRCLIFDIATRLVDVTCAPRHLADFSILLRFGLFFSELSEKIEQGNFRN